MSNTQQLFRTKRNPLALAICLLGLTEAPAALAQPAEGGQGSSVGRQIEEVIVQARRRDESLSELGLTVTAVSQKQLDVFRVGQPADLARAVPGFQATESNFSGAPVYVLRGVGFDSLNRGSTAPVGIYVDQVAYAYPILAKNVMFDLERVEVLKGPQGTLYGRNTTGGLVNFITGKPTEVFEGQVRLAYGRYDTTETEGFISGPLSDNLRARFAFKTRDRDEGWQESVSRDDKLGTLSSDAARLSLDWDATDKLNISFAANYWKETGDPQAAQAIAFTGNPNAIHPDLPASLIPNPSDGKDADWIPFTRQPNAESTGSFRPDIEEDTDAWGIALKLNYEIDANYAVEYLLARNGTQGYSVRDNSGVRIESVKNNTWGDLESNQHEIRLIAEFDRFNWTVGGYYTDDKRQETTVGWAGELSTIRNLRNVAISLGFDPDPVEGIGDSFRNFGSTGRSKEEVKALFANGQYRVTDQVGLTAGFRYTEDDISGEACGRDVQGNQVPLVNAVYPLLTGNPDLRALQPNECLTLTEDLTDFTLAESSSSEESVAWRLGVDYTLTDDALLYAVVSKGNKSGSVPVIAASNEVALTPVSPEELLAYEVGTKLSLLDRRVQLNASAYFYDYQDRQIFGRVPDAVFGTLIRVVNIPESEAYGAEFELDAAIGEYFSGRLAAAYQKTEVTDFLGISNTSPVPTDYSGSELPFSPEWQFSASLVADVPINEGLMFHGAVSASYQTDSYSALGEQDLFQVDDYAVVGLQAGIGDSAGRWRVDAIVENLFDEYYWTSTQPANETAIRYAGMPRTWRIQATVSF